MEMTTARKKSVRERGRFFKARIAARLGKVLTRRTAQMAPPPCVPSGRGSPP